MREYKLCLWCGKKFCREPKNKHNWQLKKFCSNKCCDHYTYYNYKKIRRQRNGFRSKRITAKCLWCENEFIMHNSQSTFCSGKCRNHYHVYYCSKKEYLKTHTKICLWCGKEFFAKTLRRKTCCKKCGGKLAETNRVRRPEYYLEQKFKNYKVKTKERNMKFDLSFKQYKDLVNGSCVYCSRRPQSQKMGLNGIDRVDNSKGYSVENCVSCCKECNFMKTNYSVEYFATRIISCYEWAKKTMEVNNGRIINSHRN